MTDTDTDHDAASHDAAQQAEGKNQQSPQPAKGGGEKGREGEQQTTERDARRRRRPLVATIGIIVVGLLVISGIVYWLETRNEESTDDAYTDGRAITIAAQVSGTVVSLDVNDN